MYGEAELLCIKTYSKKFITKFDLSPSSKCYV